MAEYTKLSELVNDEFTVEKAYGYSWKMWDAESKRMLVSDTYERGYSKRYTLLTNRGYLDIGSGQLGNLLELVYDKGKSDITGRTFKVSSNGKEGKDIRYYFKPTMPTIQVDDVVDVNVDEPIRLEDIPF